MARITNEGLSIMIGSLDKKVDEMVEQQKVQNGRTFKNSTDIAKMKGASGVIAFVVSFVTSIIGIYFGTRQ